MHHPRKNGATSAIREQIDARRVGQTDSPLKTTSSWRSARLITDARFSVGSPASLHRHKSDPGPPTRIRHTGLRGKVRYTHLYART